MDRMILATSATKNNSHLPLHVSEKLDGVASIWTVTPEGVVGQTRQGEPIPSAVYVQERLTALLKGNVSIGTQVLGELTVDGVPNFKDASGVIRRLVPDDRIVLNVYDFVPFGQGDWDFETRMLRALDALKLTEPRNAFTGIVRRIPGGYANNWEEAELLIKVVFQQNPRAEGVIFRPLHGKDSLYRVGRSKGLQRLVVTPTIDLQVISYEEAKSDAGRPLGMVGRINCRYGDEVVGVGPGKFSHAERKEMWAEWPRDRGRILTIKYKADESYNLLRQPTAQHWHEDKSEPDAPVEGNFIRIVDKTTH